MRQGYVAHVVVEMKVLIIDPDRSALDWHRGKPLPISRDRIEAGEDQLPDDVDVNTFIAR
jgi:hypothetical protein